MSLSQASGEGESFGDLMRLGKAGVGVAEDVVIFLFEILRAVFVDEVRLRFHAVFAGQPRY